LLSFSGTRTYHRMTVRIEDAGFEIRDMVQWLYGSGFPKSHDVSKAIDREAGAERERIRPVLNRAGNGAEVLDALGGRAVIFDGLGARVGHLLDEMDEWIERAGAAERRLKKAEEVVLMARQLTAYAWEDRLEDCEVSDSAKHDSRELSTAVWLYDQEAKS
jgi:site-specific DNA-methyltransferase (adenine-specific)